MTRIVTAHGLGELINTETVRGRTSYLVKGTGFQAWFDATDVHIAAADDGGGGATPLFADTFEPYKFLDPTSVMHGGGTEGFANHTGTRYASDPADRSGDSWAGSADKGDREHEQYDVDPEHWEDPEETGHLGDFWRWNDERHHHASDNFDDEGRNVNEDNSTVLPWDPTPQQTLDSFGDEQTILPGDFEIDSDDRLSPSDSRTFNDESANRPSPGPDPKLFAESRRHYAEDSAALYMDDTGERDWDDPDSFPQPPKRPGRKPTRSHSPNWKDHDPHYRQRDAAADDHYLDTDPAGAEWGDDDWHSDLPDGPESFEKSAFGKGPSHYTPPRSVPTQGWPESSPAGDDGRDYTGQPRNPADAAPKLGPGEDVVYPFDKVSPGGEGVEEMGGFNGDPEWYHCEDCGAWHNPFRHMHDRRKSKPPSSDDAYAPAYKGASVLPPLLADSGQHRVHFGEDPRDNDHYPAEDSHEWLSHHPDGAEEQYQESPRHAASVDLGPRYASIPDAPVHDPFLRYPLSFMGRQASILEGTAGLDPRVGDHMNLVLANKDIRTAAWRDVRSKAKRLRSEGRVSIKKSSPEAIYASVDGDTGTYETIIVRGNVYDMGGQSVTAWHCGCPWGQWAFKRRLTFVGRFCSHAYATYMEMQSQHDEPGGGGSRMKPKRRKKRQAGIVEDFKTWAKDNDQPTDEDSMSDFVGRPTEDENGEQEPPYTADEIQQLYDYVDGNQKESPQREFDVPYTFDQDKVYKNAGTVEDYHNWAHQTGVDPEDSLEHYDQHVRPLSNDEYASVVDSLSGGHGGWEPGAGPGAHRADALRMTPRGLTPSLQFVPEGEDEHLVDVTEDDRKTTGPGQITTDKTANRYEDLWSPEEMERLKQHQHEQDEPEIEHFASILPPWMRQGAGVEGFGMPDIPDVNAEDPSGGSGGSQDNLGGSLPGSVPATPMGGGDRSNGGLGQDNFDGTDDSDSAGAYGGGFGGFDAMPTMSGGGADSMGANMDNLGGSAGAPGDNLGGSPDESGSTFMAYHYADTEDDYEVHSTGEAAGNLDKLRDLIQEPLEDSYGEMAERNDEVRNLVDDLHDQGVDANNLVARRRSVSTRPDGTPYNSENAERPDILDHYRNFANSLWAGDVSHNSVEDYLKRNPHTNRNDVGKLIDLVDRHLGSVREGGGGFFTPGGPDWMDEPFQGSGADPKDWYSSSDDWVDKNERPRFEDVTDLGDGDTTRYNDSSGPVTSPRQAAMARLQRQADAFSDQTSSMEPQGANIDPPESTDLGNDTPLTQPEDAGGTIAMRYLAEDGFNPNNPDPMAFGPDPEMHSLTPQSEATNLHGGAGAGDYGAPMRSAPGQVQTARRSVRDSIARRQRRQGWDDSTLPPGWGSSPEQQDDGQHGPQGPPGGPEGEEAEGAEGAMGRMAPELMAVASQDGDSDILRAFHATAGAAAIKAGNAGGGGGGGRSDVDIAGAAAQFLQRTAGRNYSPAEQAELVDEYHPEGARNLAGLDLRGTHYVQ